MRAKIEAIISILLILPISSHIHIYINNLLALQTLKNLSYNNYTQIKQLNQDIIYIINSLIKSKNISCTFHKIISYSKNTYYNIADKLAKKETNKLPLKINLKYFTPLSFFTWQNNFIPIKLCQFNKSLFFIQTLNNITQLKIY